MRFGIIGSGIAGLTAAWALDRSGHDVDLFECGSSLGMAAQTVDLNLDDKVRVGDVPSRMFNRLQWPNLCLLYDLLGVDTVPVEPSQTFSHLHGPVYLRLKNAYRAKLDRNFLLDRTVRKILKTAAELKSAGVRDLAAGLPSDLTLGSYLSNSGVSRDFISDFLYPTLSSTVCTCSYASLDAYPASIILQALRELTADGETLLKTTRGTRDVVNRLVSGNLATRLNTRVHQIDAPPTGPVDLKLQLPDGRMQTETFDHVVVSTQANHARDLLNERSAEDREILAMFDYESIPVVVHLDSRLMPPRRGHWGTFNMISERDPQPAAMCTVLMNQFHSDWQMPSPAVFQTINPILEPDSGKVIQAAVLQRPLVNRHSQVAWERLSAAMLRPGRRIWFCGSYAVAGVPLLETGVVSAVNVLQALDVELPFTDRDLAASSKR